MSDSKFNTRTVAFMGMLFALALTLSFFESAIAGMMALPPGVKPGLSNIVILFAMLLLKPRHAIVLAVLKSLFVFLTRGAVAGLLSFSGGMCSILIMLLLAKAPFLSLSVQSLSAAGAIAHNIGQICAAAFIIKTKSLFYYLPVLLISGIITGILTGTVYKAAQPYFKKILSGMRI